MKRLMLISLRVLTRSIRSFGDWVASYAVGFLGVCIALAALLFLMDVRWEGWMPRFGCWYRFWTTDSASVRNLALVVGGLLAATVGLFLAAVRTVALHRQSLADEAQAALAENRHVTERFSKAIEQLSHDKLAVRLGAVYALEQVARDSPEVYHWPIMETLTAFARLAGSEADAAMPQSGAGAEAAGEAEIVELPPVAFDVSAAIAVIARRNAENDPAGRYLDLSGANLNELSLANVTPKNLARARLIKTNLSGANLSGADLSGATLSDAALTGANLSNAHLPGAIMFRVDLSGATLLEADMWKAILSGATLSGANLLEANLPGASLNGANLSDAYLSMAFLEAADLTTANLSRANLHEANFYNALLPQADLSEADLSNAIFAGAILTGADLSGAILSATLLSGANLVEANLTGARSITAQQLFEAYDLRLIYLDDGVRAELETLLESDD